MDFAEFSEKIVKDRLGNNRAARRVYDFPRVDELDDLISQTIGRLRYADMDFKAANVLADRRYYNLSSLAGQPDQVRVTHKASFSQEPNDRREQELVPPDLGKQLLSEAHWLSVERCRMLLRLLFQSSAKDATLKENLVPRWKIFREIFIEQAANDGGFFNLFRFRAYLFFHKTQMAPPDQFPVTERAEETVVADPDEITYMMGQSYRLNIGGLKGARLLEEGGVGGPRMVPLPERLRELVFVCRETLALSDIPDRKPFTSPLSLLVSHPNPKILARSTAAEMLTAGMVDRLQAALLTPIMTNCLAGKDPSTASGSSLKTGLPHTEPLAPCFFCNKLTRGRQARNGGVSKFLEQPLLASQDMFLIVCCPAVEGGANKCVKKAQGALDQLFELVGHIGAPPEKPLACAYMACPRRVSSATSEKIERLMRCSRCKITAYCSAECQKLDWPSHKEKCVSTVKGETKK